jgi:hypothetical protein
MTEVQLVSGVQWYNRPMRLQLKYTAVRDIVYPFSLFANSTAWLPVTALPYLPLHGRVELFLNVF